MKAELKKEWFFLTRNYKVLIILITFLFIAISTPIILNYVLPAVLRSQFPGLSNEDLNQFITLTQAGSMTNYMSDMIELGLIILVFTLSGILAAEIKENTLVLPICSGKRYGTILLAKYIASSLLLFVSVIIGFLVTYLYSGIIFAFDLSFIVILKAIITHSVFMSFVVSLILLFGMLTKKSLITGLATIISVYFLLYIGSLFDINAFLPIGLLSESQAFTETFSRSFYYPLIITILLITLSSIMTYLLIKKNEWNTR